MPRIVVLISGRGSNLRALLEAELEGRLGGSVVLVISNRADAAGLDIARQFGVATEVIDHNGRERASFDADLGRAIERNACDLVVLAGFMRILTREFVQRYEARMINIHPSLLPSFGGLATHRRALDEGVRVHGCTVHFVTADLDHGPIIAQGAVPVLPDDDEARLSQRVLAVEHRLLPAAVRAWCEGRLVIAGGRVRVLGEEALECSVEVPQLR
ncbi:MAG TPA: phosphoribosylglycinamide formyltransferase [Casimicrobiaceae bacterium]|nr:phosphoribosylglycinamide formyltransferase [Casimicrobiaceae bacterium]